jgi:hypothetical protein
MRTKGVVWRIRNRPGRRIPAAASHLLFVDTLGTRVELRVCKQATCVIEAGSASRHEMGLS